MVLKGGGEVIGDCGLTRQIVDGVEEIELGYHVRRDLWGQGLAPEAARACRDYGFDRLHTERIISLVRIGNLPSAASRKRSEWSYGKKRPIEIWRTG